MEEIDIQIIIERLTLELFFDFNKGFEIDELNFRAAAELIVNNQDASSSLLKRKLNFKYNKAVSIEEQLIAFGILSGQKGASREVLIKSIPELNSLLNKLNIFNETNLLRLNESLKSYFNSNEKQIKITRAKISDLNAKIEIDEYKQKIIEAENCDEKQNYYDLINTIMNINNYIQKQVY